MAKDVRLKRRMETNAVPVSCVPRQGSLPSPAAPVIYTPTFSPLVPLSDLFVLGCALSLALTHALKRSPSPLPWKCVCEWLMTRLVRLSSLGWGPITAADNRGGGGVPGCFPLPELPPEPPVPLLKAAPTSSSFLVPLASRNESSVLSTAGLELSEV